MRSSSTNQLGRNSSDARSRKTLAMIVPPVYDELCLIAASLLRHERPDLLFEPAELVHETYIRLAQYGPDDYVNRAQFFYIAVGNMHRVLTDLARRRTARKRGGDWQRVALDDVQLSCPEVPELRAIDEALARLESATPQLGRIADFRLRNDLSAKEIAKAVGIAESTARKKWNIARTQLRKELAGSDGETDTDTVIESALRTGSKGRRAVALLLGFAHVHLRNRSLNP
jgi:RNA polymerase sigma-70 factor, ECF subfamily